MMGGRDTPSLGFGSATCMRLLTSVILLPCMPQTWTGLSKYARKVLRAYNASCQ